MAAVMGEVGSAVARNLEQLTDSALIDQLLGFAVEGMPAAQTAYTELDAEAAARRYGPWDSKTVLPSWNNSPSQVSL